MLRLILIFVGCVAGFAACGGQDGAGSDRTGSTRRLRFAVIPKVVDHPVFHYARTGAERMAKQLGDVDIEWRGPDSGDELRQKEILESFIAQRVDGIAISTLNGDFLTGTINRAVDAGIPVVTWDSDAPKSKRLAFYGVDDRAAGRRLGEEAVRLVNGQGTVAIITTLGATNLQHRLEGVREALGKAPGIRILEVFDIKEDIVRCAEVIATASRRYPDLDAWISVGGWPVFTRTSLANIDPAKTKFLAFDTVGSGLDLLREGKVQILIGQKYFGWGSESVRLLHEIKNGRMPPSPIIDSGVDVVTKENVEEYAARWKELESGTTR